MLDVNYTDLQNPLHREFVKKVHQATRDELFESLFTYLNPQSTTEIWAQNVIKREIARREDEKRKQKM